MVGALALMLISVVTLPVTYANRQHSNLFYQIAAGGYPLVLTAVIAACPGRMPATRAALIYMLGLGAMVWVLPLFPARPLTGPVYQAHDHLMPPPFPLLLVAPALGVGWTDDADTMDGLARECCVWGAVLHRLSRRPMAFRRVPPEQSGGQSLLCRLRTVLAVLFEDR
jgi:hypothetical protein